MLKKCLFLLLPLALLMGCSKFHKLQKSSDIDEKFQGAVDYYQKKDYFRAGILLEELLPLLKGTEQAERAQFMFAYCHYEQKQLVLSSYYFKNFAETFPRSPLAEEANFMFCVSLYEDSPPYNLDQTNTYSAIDALQNFALNYPNNPNIEKINQKIDDLNFKLETKDWENTRLYYRKGDFKAAIVAFDNFIHDYPESRFKEEAGYLKIISAYNYANDSVEKRQAERFNNASSFYQDWIELYPGSKYAPDAKNYYNAAQARLQALQTKTIN